ncbi:PF06252 family protein [Leptospira santarosai]|uniref:PF06252 family protein n=1 Tax=Leptospira santarosai TaxID=28183 RepID=A0A2P1QRY7_9LEPT|nr:PF06252 family protein [Leptospira santarosai]
MITDSKINSDQLKKLWVTAREAGVSKPKVYEIVLNETGSESISALSALQANTVIGVLEAERQRIFKQKPKDSISILKRKLQKRSYDQLQLAKSLCYKINQKGFYNIDLDTFSKRQYRKSFDLLTRKQAAGLIQGLIAILGR